MILSFCSKLGISSLILFTGLILLFLSKPANALDGSNFKPGNIIDDSVFYNSNTMNADQIQIFLNSKVPVCDTNGSQIYSGSTTRAQYGASRGYPAPYICLKDYTQSVPTITNGGSDLCKNSISGGTKSAAQIIKEVSHACGINPQVLLVMLQKEQSLITDVWPWPSQYDKAMGYACPDSGPNNSANCDSEFFGFFNQVYNAAKAYRRYEANPNSYNYKANRNNTILWHPNSSCGTSNVFIENQATASLYIYTPYRPNQAALNNLYGTGDSCSSYGNRNFWRMFNDWFGPTTGSLIRTTTSDSLYFSDGSRKYSVPSMQIASEYGLGLSDVRFISQQEMDGFPNASNPYNFALRRLVKTPDNGTVYLVSAGYKFPISSWSMLVNHGFDGDDIGVISEDALSRLITSPNPLTDIVRGFSNGTVYKIENGRRRIIFELSKLSELLQTSDLSKLSDLHINSIGYGTPLVDGDYVVKRGNSLRLYSSDNYHLISNINSYVCLGLSSIKTFTVSSYGLTNGNSQGSLSCIIEDSSGNGYIAEAGKKYPLTPGHLLKTTAPTDSFIARLNSASLGTVLKNKNGKTLSILENGKLRPIPSMEVFNALGFSSSDITSISGSTFNSIGNGPHILTPGTLFKNKSSNSIFVTGTSNDKYSVSSASQFQSYGYDWTKINTVSDETLAFYSTTSSLPQLFNNSSGTLLSDSGILYSLDATLNNHYGINPATLPSINDQLIKSTASALTRFVKSPSSSTIYYVESGQKRPISSWATLIGLGGESSIVTLSSGFIQTISSGSSI